MSFTKHYYDEAYNLHEGILTDIAKAGLTGIGKLYRTLRPKVKKIKNFDDIINPSNVVEVPCSLISSLSMLLGGDTVKWRSMTKNKNILQKFILGGKEVYAKDNWAGLIVPELHDEMQEVFKLTDKWYLVSMDIYRLTNNSKITLIRISDPYKGDVGDDRQAPPKKVEHIARTMQNCKGFISITSKSDEWFLSKFGQRFNEFIQSRYKPNERQWRQDLADIEQSYQREPDNTTDKDTLKGDEPKKKVVRTDVKKLPNGVIIKTKHQYSIPQKDFDLLGYSIGKGSLKSKLENDFKNVDTFKDGKMVVRYYNLDGNGQITLFRDIDRNKHYILADDIGNNILKSKNIIKD